MNRINSFSKLILLLLLALTGCKEFFEPSLEHRKVVLLAPANGTEGPLYAQSFWWDDVEDALKYRLQVVSPNFANTARLVLDTVITGNKFNFTLDPGNYEWRVRAENGSSQSQFTTAAFAIYASSIKQQQPQLQSPVNNLISNVNNATFKWLKLYGADKYQLEIDTNSFADETRLFFNKTITTLAYNVPFTRDKIYQWRVKALNDTAESKWSVIQNITFDSTPPAAVILVSPAIGASVATPVSIKWNTSATAAKYQLYLYKSDQTTLYSSSFPMTLTTNSYTFTGLPGERVYWEVRPIDAVGNGGEFSAFWNFTVQ